MSTTAHPSKGNTISNLRRLNRPSRSRRGLMIAAFVGLIAVSAGSGLIVSHIDASPGDGVTCVVDSKDRVAKPKGGSDMRIYLTCDGQPTVMAVKDDFFRMKFDSADTYHSLEEGRSYTIEAYGIRIPFLSAFPNIVSAVEAAPAEATAQ